MKNQRFSKLKFAFAILLTFILVTSLVHSASANVRFEGAGNLPYYARIGYGENYHNNTWAVIIFYRPPECIPTDFNLLDFFDIPRAFACTPYTTDGFIIWKYGPTDPAPIQVKLFGLGAVPVWFVSWPALESAIADGWLKMDELRALSPLIGSASFYEETLHPSGGKHPSMIEIRAQGNLTDGRTFDVHIDSTDAKMVADTHIVFK